MKKKSIILLLALTLIAGAVIGGTIAWLTAKTDPIKNTFTTSDINITLEETNEDFKMIPGHTIGKDPKVTVEAGSEPAWLFVKLEKSDNFDNFMTYGIADGWTELEEDSGVYYRKVENTAENQVFTVLEKNQVSVRDSVTKENMDSLNDETLPTLTVTAYATQLYREAEIEFTALEAWDNVANLESTP